MFLYVLKIEKMNQGGQSYLEKVRNEEESSATKAAARVGQPGLNLGPQIAGPKGIKNGPGGLKQKRKA